MPPFYTQEDFQSLISPISDKDPCGPHLIYETLYDEIKEARQHEDEHLPQGIWIHTLKKAQWDRVSDLCLHALKTQTKDLQIAAWLTESWLIQHGLDGFAKGLELMVLLCQKFWGKIHPTMRSGDPEYRLSPFYWMDEKLPQRLYLVSVTAPKAGQKKPLTFSHWKSAHANTQKKTLKKNLSLKKKPVTLETFEASIQDTSTPFFQGLIQASGASKKSIQHLETMIASYDPSSGRCLSSLTNLLGDIETYARAIAQKRGVQESLSMNLQGPPATITMTQKSFYPPLHEKEESMQSAPLDSSSCQPQDIPMKSPSSRQQAYEHLKIIADYLEGLEPHSPTPHLLRRAIKWGDMSLNELLAELLKDPQDARHIWDLLGLQKPKTLSTSPFTEIKKPI